MNLPMLLLFLGASLIHFFFCFIGSRKGYLWTKPFLVPLLLGVYLLSARHISPLAVGALICGFVGDVVLELPYKSKDPTKPNPPMLIGLGAFLLGHVFYIILFAGQVAAYPMLETFLLALAAAGLFLLVLRSFFSHMGAMLLPGTTYLAVLMVMVFFAALSGLTVPIFPRIPGALLFLLSDYILARGILVEKGRYNDLMVMLTYLCAQFSLVCSLLM